MQHLIFGFPPWLLAALELVLILVAIEAGFRIGRRRARAAIPDKGQTTTIQAAILGFLGLLLGFTFSLSQSRFDARRQLVIAEANAIGTTYLRAELLPAPYDARAVDLLRQYARTRLPRPNVEAVEEAVARSEELHRKLWQLEQEVAKNVDDTAVVLLFTESLNETIDLHAKRVAAYLYRAPGGLLLLLLLSAALAMGVAGFANGLDNDRNFMVILALATLMAVVLGLILDLEHSGSGMFQTSPRPLIEVQQSIGAVQNR